MPHSLETSPPGARPGHLGGRAAIAIVGHRRDGHARSLIKRLGALGARASFVELSTVTFSTLHPGGLVLPGFGPHLPDGVIVRGIAAGSFEAVPAGSASCTPFASTAFSSGTTRVPSNAASTNR